MKIKKKRRADVFYVRRTRTSKPKCELKLFHKKNDTVLWLVRKYVRTNDKYGDLKSVSQRYAGEILRSCCVLSVFSAFIGYSVSSYS